jgi:large conductance mechanosensitive channel
MLKEFKAFVLRGNVMDLAVGVIIGGAFGKIVASLVSDIILPPLGFLLGNMDFANLYLVIRGADLVPAGSSLAAAQAIAGVITWNYGLFITNIINFVILALVIFLMVKAINKMQRQPAPAAPNTKECPRCFTVIPIQATRCPHCTSELK